MKVNKLIIQTEKVFMDSGLAPQNAANHLARCKQSLFQIPFAINFV
jgi:hypothetical protein